MYCRKCGNQINDNARFCNKCGTGIEKLNLKHSYVSEKNCASPNKYPKINSPAMHKNNLTTKTRTISKKPIIITSVVAAVVFTFIIGLVACVIVPDQSIEGKLTGHVWYCESREQTLKFNKDGTYIRTLSSGKTKNGHWSITDNVLRMGNSKYDWWNNLDDKSIANQNVGREYYSWYVSDQYFITCDDCVYGADRPDIFEVI